MNEVKGEVSFEANGKTYIFKLGTNAQVLLESKINMSLAKWMKDKAEDLSTSDVRMIMWAGLFRNHQLTEEEAGDLIDAIGPDKAAELFLQAFSSAAPQRGNGNDSRPTKTAKERIGMNS